MTTDRLVLAPRCGARPRRSQTGVSLVELLVATVIAGVALCGAWVWLWNAGVAGSSTVDRSRAATAAAYAARSIADDLETSTDVQAPPAVYTAGQALSLLHVHPGAAPEAVLIVWDPARRVVWRKASGTYLADHVRRFAVTYYDTDGRPLTTADLQTSSWPGRVARVEVEIVISTGRETGEAVCDVALGQR